MNQAVEHKPGRGRYEMDIDGATVFATYRREGATIYILHVEAPPALRGTGAAGRFMQGLMESLQADKLRPVAVCSYAAAWMERHRQAQE